MLEFLKEYIFMSNINPFQIILTALLGAIVGELKKDLVDTPEEPMRPSLFFAEIVIATFISSICGIVLLEFNIFKDRSVLVLLVSSTIGYVGYDNALRIITVFLKAYLISKNVEYDKKDLDEVIRAVSNEDIKGAKSIIDGVSKEKKDDDDKDDKIDDDTGLG